MKILILIILVISFIFSTEIGEVRRYNGISIGSRKATFHLEAYFDLLCPYSRNSYKNLLESFKESLLLSHENMKFTVHFLPLPYNRESSYIQSLAVHHVQSTFGDAHAFKFMSLIFTHQEEFSKEKTQTKTRIDIENDVANLASTYLSYNLEEFLAGIRSDKANNEAKYSFEFACSKGVFSTPTFLGNGVEIEGANEFSPIDWTNLLTSNVVN